MKRAFALFLLLPVLLLNGCVPYLIASVMSVPEDAVVASLGDFETEEYYTSGGFQDFTDYAKYTYRSVDFDRNEYFEKITPYSKKAFLEHVENFEMWVETIEEYEPENDLVVGYDFDVSVITEDDYIYILDDPSYNYLGCYDMYLFDMETMTLHYFHNNI